MYFTHLEIRGGVGEEVIPVVFQAYELKHIYVLHLLLCRSVPLEKDVDWQVEISKVAQEIKGFSGREISKLAIAWQVGNWELLRCE